MATVLPLTGERTVPGLAEENYWFRRHEVVYQQLVDRCTGRDVLEAGSGEGYGADLIAGRRAARSSALDYDEAAVAHVRARYPRVEMRQGNLAELPLADGSVDVVVNFQVIEHLWDQGQFVAECARVLRPSGTVADVDAEPDHVLPRPRHPAQPVPHPRAQRRRTHRAADRRGLRGPGHARRAPRRPALRAGRQARRLDHRRADRACAGRRAMARRPARRRGVGHAPTDFDLLDATASARSTRAWIWWPSRCDRDDADARSRFPGSSPWCCTPTCPGWPTTAAGRSARNGSTSPGRRPTCRWCALLRRLSDEGRSHLLTLGMTPVVTAQLDDPYCLDGMHHWLANWQLRGQEAAVRRGVDGRRLLGSGGPARLRHS